MRHLPITDADRAWWQSLGKPDTARDIVAASLADVGATPAEPAPTEQSVEMQPQLPVATYRQLFGALAIVAVALLAVYALRPSTRPTPTTPAPAMAPAATAAPPTATIAPTAEPSPTAPPTATPEPPTAEPEVIYIEVAPPCDPANPPYVVEQEVRDDRGIPLGTVTGTSCESQDAARANAAQLAEEMREK